MAWFDFVSYDDHGFIHDNPQVCAGLTLSGVLWAFQHSVIGNWHPLTLLSHMLDCQLYGLNAGGHHVTNLLFHVANTLLLFQVFKQMTGALWRSAFVAALFALHPLHVESVAWVSERKDVLSTFFFMLTLCAYVRYVETKSESRKQKGEIQVPASRHLPSSIFYLLALTCFALGLMSKAMLVTLPFVLLLLDYWPLRRFQFTSLAVSPELQFANVKRRPSSPRLLGAAKRSGDGSTLNSQLSTVRRLLWEKLPFFLLAAVLAAVTFCLQKQAGAMVALAKLPFTFRLANALTSYANYLRKSVWPDDLAVFYPYPDFFPTWKVAFAGIVLVAITVAVVLAMRRRPYLPVGWFWFFGMLAPVIGLVQVGGQAMADRYTYVPLIGVFVALVWGGNELLDRWRVPRAIVGSFATLIALACGLRSADQLRHWRNSETLFRHAIEVTERNYIAYDNLGVLLQRQGKVDQAIACYTQALRFKPADAEAHSNLGHALMSKGRLDEAQIHLERALQINPKLADADFNLATLLSQQGKIEAAISVYRRALVLNDNLPDVHNNLGGLLMLQGKLDEAITHFHRALRYRPNYDDALNNLGSALMKRGRASEAVAPLMKAIQLQPAFVEAHYNLGNAYRALDRLAEAVAEYRTAIRHNPNFGPAHYQLATILVARREVAEGIKHYQETVRLEPTLVEALNELAWLLATQRSDQYRDGKQAVALATRAVELTRTNDPAVLDTLAAAYAEIGEFSEALASAKKAVALANKSGEQKQAEEIKLRLRLYEQAKPYREGEGEKLKH